MIEFVCLKLQKLWEIAKPWLEKVGALCKKKGGAYFDTPPQLPTLCGSACQNTCVQHTPMLFMPNPMLAIHTPLLNLPTSSPLNLSTSYPLNLSIPKGLNRPLLPLLCGSACQKKLRATYSHALHAKSHALYPYASAELANLASAELAYPSLLNLSISYPLNLPTSYPLNLSTPKGLNA